VKGERKRLVDDIFLSAADLPPNQRQAFLEIACPDEEIAGEVRSLLMYDAGGASALDSVVQQAARSFISGDALIGTHLGPYRITEEIGKGGMGAVFLAIRDDRTFEKKVAVKIVKRGMDSAAVLGRFRHERRILANLDHPYIGRLLDAGTTPDGRPYFVMEYVEGEPIVRYCAMHRLELPAVLELFRKVCDAVSCAHRNLIVHRDLKAGNILVAGDGSPKLLDFGIAKLLDQQSQMENTAPTGRMLTLECASPEQIRGETVTTATDVHSLGLLLFELLAGRPPWDFASMSTREIEQTICYKAAPKPSSVAREAGASKNWRAIEGDLDNIVLMALRKDPATRYRSVDEFSMDLVRYKSGLAVIAREDSFLYRGLKFLRRHRVAAAGGTLSILGLLGGLIYANVQRLQAEARLTQMLGLANQTLLDLHAQIAHQPGSTETRLRIMQSTLNYLANLAKDSGNNQEVRTTLGTAYLRTGDVQGYPSAANLGNYSGALASYAEAEKLFSPSDDVHIAALLGHRGDVLCKLGRTGEGIAVLQSALTHAARSDSTESQMAAAEAYHRLAFVLTQSNPEEALANSRRETEIYARLAEREPDNVEVLNGLVSSYSTTGGALNRRYRFRESLVYYRKGLAIRELLVAKNPGDVTLRRDLLISYGRVGDILGNPTRGNLGDKVGAIENFRKGLAIAEFLATADPKNELARMDLAQIRSRIGMVMDDPKQARESLTFLDSGRASAALVEKDKEFTKEQLVLIAWVDETRGDRLAALGDLRGALAAFRLSAEEAQSVTQRDPNDSSSRAQILSSRRGVAIQLGSMGRREEALAVSKEVFDKAAQLALSGPDRTMLAIFVPRSYKWWGATYEALARQDSSPAQRRADWASASEKYAHAVEQWQTLHARADFAWFQTEIGECSRKSLECGHRSKQGS
jgi:eukaryotic-like serine/threonine-protein kinase